MKQNSRTGQISSTQAQRLLARDLNRCVACGRAITGKRRAQWDIHLRIPRPAPGQPDDPRVLFDSNLAVVCGYAGTRCAGAILHYPIAARDRGLVLWRGQRPWLVPLHVWTGTERGHLLDEETEPYLLDDDGARSVLTVVGRVTDPMGMAA